MGVGVDLVVVSIGWFGQGRLKVGQLGNSGRHWSVGIVANCQYLFLSDEESE